MTDNLFELAGSRKQQETVPGKRRNGIRISQ